MSPASDLLVVLVCLAGSAFFSGMETGIVAINRVRLRHLVKRREPRALLLRDLLENPDRLLGTTLVGNNLVNAAMTVAGTSLLVGLTGSPRLGGALAGILLTLLILVFGEYLPKAWFQSHPLNRTARFVRLFSFFGRLFQGASVPIVALVRHLIPAGADASSLENRARVTRKDIQFLLSRESGATPDLGEQRRRMVIGVFALSDKTARDVMIPRERMLRISPDTPMPEILALAARSGVKSLPVWSEAEQRFTGLLKVADLFPHIDDPDLRLPDLIRPPQYVAADTPADDLLPRLRLSRQPMLLIRDEAGLVVGFVTTEAVLEEIVGPLHER